MAFTSPDGITLCAGRMGRSETDGRKRCNSECYTRRHGRCPSNNAHQSANRLRRWQPLLHVFTDALIRFSPTKFHKQKWGNCLQQMKMKQHWCEWSCSTVLTCEQMLFFKQIPKLLFICQHPVFLMLLGEIRHLMFALDYSIHYERSSYIIRLTTLLKRQSR